MLNHLTAALIRRQPVEPFFLAIENADAGRPVHLMSAEHEEIIVEVLHVNLEVRGALSAVYHNRNVMAVGNAYYLLHRVDRAEHIADMRHADDLRAGRYKLFKLIKLQLTVVSHRYHLHHYALAACLQLPRHDIGMMFHSRDNNLIALFHELIREG